jgi:hydroxypyruvate isomerase
MLRRDFLGTCAGSALGVLSAGPIDATLPGPPRSFAGPDAGETPFHLSVMLWTVYRQLPFAQRLEKVAEAGYRAVELVDEFVQWTKADFAAARARAKELGIVFDGTAGVWHSLADPADRAPFLKGITAFLPTMRELECDRLILQTGNKVAGMSPEQMRAACIETLKHAGDLAAENHIELLIENIDPEENPKYFLTSSAEGFDIVRAVSNPHVKFLYDLFHEQIAEGNLLAKLEKNVSLVGLIHIADVPGRHEPGSGEINFQNVYRKLAAIGYNHYVAMEFEPLGDAVSALRAARETALQFGKTPAKPTTQLNPSGRPYASA